MVTLFFMGGNVDKWRYSTSPPMKKWTNKNLSGGDIPCSG